MSQARGKQVMGLFDRICTSLSPTAHPLERLAVTAGRCETLAANLKRHAAMCDYPNIKAGLGRLAEAEAVQANALRVILTAHGAWPRLPETPLHEGTSNWERVSADLALLAEIHRDINLHAVEWESVEPGLAARLRGLSAAENDHLGKLRDLALKCDPQAFN
ncbi:MAG: hypothetical protein ACREQN_15885 [Candidatus Binataceae bacterium]